MKNHLYIAVLTRTTTEGEIEEANLLLAEESHFQAKEKVESFTKANMRWLGWKVHNVEHAGSIKDFQDGDVQII